MYAQEGTISQTQLRKVLGLVIEVVRQEAYVELLFDYLKVIAPTEQDEKYLQTMLEDERAHFQELKQLYSLITGQEASGDAPTFDVPSSYIAGIQQVFNQKLEVINIYKQIERSIPYSIGKQMVVRFVTDELRHLSMLNHLILLKQNSAAEQNWWYRPYRI